MHSKIKLFVIALATMSFTHGLVASESTSAPSEPTRGILLVTFGTSEPEAKAAFEHIGELAQERFPDTPIYWAYTSSIIRKKLLRQGEAHDSPLAAMCHMRDAGIDEIAVQSLHTIAGTEYDQMLQYIAAFQSTDMAFDQIAVGGPLLNNAEDLDRAITAILAEAKDQRQPGDMLILMGHGSEHNPADLTYVAASSVVREQDPTAALGTVEGHPTFADVLELAQASGTQHVTLMPFMSVAGDHARNDMAGDEPDSWKSQFEAVGIEATPVLQGMGEYKSIVDIWLDHLDGALLELKEPQYVSID